MNGLSPTNPLLDSNRETTLNAGQLGDTGLPGTFVETAMTQMIRTARPIDREIWSSMRTSLVNLKLLVESRFPEDIIIFVSSLKQMELEAEAIDSAANSPEFWLQGPSDALYTMMKQLQDPWRQRLDLMAKTYTEPRHPTASITDEWDADDSASTSEDINTSTLADANTFTGETIGKRKKMKKRVKKQFRWRSPITFPVRKPVNSTSKTKTNGDSNTKKPPKRPRGRPPITFPVRKPVNNTSKTKTNGDSNTKKPPKRPRGRPPKSKSLDDTPLYQAESTSTAAKDGKFSTETSDEEPTKRPRGWLKKIRTLHDGLFR